MQQPLQIDPAPPSLQLVPCRASRRLLFGAVAHFSSLAFQPPHALLSPFSSHFRAERKGKKGQQASTQSEQSAAAEAEVQHSAMQLRSLEGCGSHSARAQSLVRIGAATVASATCASRRIRRVGSSEQRSATPAQASAVRGQQGGCRSRRDQRASKLGPLRRDHMEERTRHAVGLRREDLQQEKPARAANPTSGDPAAAAASCPCAPVGVSARRRALLSSLHCSAHFAPCVQH